MKKFFCLFFTTLLVLSCCIGCTKTPDVDAKSSPKRTGEAADKDQTGFWTQSSPGQTGSAAAGPEETDNPAAGATKTLAVPAWRLTDTEYMVSERDLDVNGGPIIKRQMGVREALYDYYQDSGEIGDMTYSVTRKGEAGQVFCSCQWEIIWSAPPDTLPAGQTVSLEVEHKALEELVWSTPVLSADFDEPDMMIFGVSSTPNRFRQPDGSDQVYNTKTTLTTQDPIAEGKEGKRMAIYIKFGEAYGMRYTYEWR